MKSPRCVDPDVDPELALQRLLRSHANLYRLSAYSGPMQRSAKRHHSSVQYVDLEHMFRKINTYNKLDNRIRRLTAKIMKPPEFQPALKTGKRVARQRLAEAKRFLEKHPEDAIEIGKVFYGRNFDEHALRRWKGRIDTIATALQSFKTSKHVEYLETYTPPAAVAGVAGTENQTNAIASTDKMKYARDPNSKYFTAYNKVIRTVMDKSYAQEEIAMTILHEMSHAVLDTHDFDARYANRVGATGEHDVSRLAGFSYKNIDLTTLQGKRDATLKWANSEKIADSFAVSTTYLAYAHIDPSFSGQLLKAFGTWQTDMTTPLQIKLPK